MCGRGGRVTFPLSLFRPSSLLSFFFDLRCLSHLTSLSISPLSHLLCLQANIDPFGESYLICMDKRSEIVAKTIVGMMPEDVDSQLVMNAKKSHEFPRLVLDAICGGYAKTVRERTERRTETEER